MRARWASWTRSDLVVLAAIVLTTVVTQVSLIWHHTVPDIDTDTFIARAGKGCSGPWIAPGMGDAAHPVGNALTQHWECTFHGSDVLSPAGSWYLVLSVALVVIVALVIAYSLRRGGGAASAAIAVGYLGISPAMRTMSDRANEKWIGAMLFLVVALCMMACHRASERWVAWLVACAVGATVLGLWHTQYLIILAAGLAPWAAVALARPSWVGTTRLRAVLLGGAVLAPPAAVIGLLLWSGYVVPVHYEELYYSIFNPRYWHGPVDWVHNFLAYSARWLTGWLDVNGEQEIQPPAPRGASFVLLGLAGVGLYTLVMVRTRDWLLVALAFGCLVLPFLYEPVNAERWDAAAVVLALGLARCLAPRRGVVEHQRGRGTTPEVSPRRAAGRP